MSAFGGKADIAAKLLNTRRGAKYRDPRPHCCLLLRCYRVDRAFLPKCVPAPAGDGKFMSNWIDGLAASIAAVILLVVFISLIWAWRRLAAMQAQLDSLSSAINSLEPAYQRLLVRFMNLPKSEELENRQVRGPIHLKKG
jgi:hypothetical protein